MNWTENRAGAEAGRPKRHERELFNDWFGWSWTLCIQHYPSYTASGGSHKDKPSAVCTAPSPQKIAQGLSPEEQQPALHTVLTWENKKPTPMTSTNDLRNFHNILNVLPAERGFTRTTAPRALAMTKLQQDGRGAISRSSKALPERGICWL